MKIIACYAVANEEDSIARSIRSVSAYVDGFIFIDSVFQANPAPGPNSTDRTEEIIRSVLDDQLNVYYHKPATKLTQVQARNLYLSLLSDLEFSGTTYALVIDGDETLHGDHAALRAFFDELRSGIRPPEPWNVPVYTTAVLVPKSAPDVTEQEFTTNPLISTVGYMERLFPVTSGLHYEILNGGSTPALISPDTGLLMAQVITPFFMINHHTSQSHASYLNDYEWETREVLDRRP